MTTSEILKARLENKPGIVGASIILRSGRYFDFLNPQLDSIQADDIAWSLAYTCRFGGHSTRFYSVAQHCVLVASILPPELQFAGLMHDAAEAFIGDMVGPLKQLCPDFKAIETSVEQVVAQRFNLTLPWGPEVKKADLRLLRTEQRDLTAGSEDSWNGLSAFEPLVEVITPWDSSLAAAKWLTEFYRLTSV